MILCGDIGATKSLFALAGMREGVIHFAFVQRYENRAWPSFASLVDDFLAAGAAATGRPVELAMAGFGIAGPVSASGVCMTNLDWHIGGDSLRTLLGGAPACLLNDFEASAWGIGDLPPEGRLTLQAGEPDTAAPQLVVGAGSGLGVAFRLPGDGGGLRVLPGEGGHVGFAPRDAQQARLWQHLQRRFGRVSAEHVVSGPGLARIYEWLLPQGGERPALTTPDSSPARPAGNGAGRGDAVWERAQAGDPQAREAVELFVDAYGAVSGDHALSVLARGGVFLTGGIGPRVLPGAAANRFLAAFRDKGPHMALMAGLPVYLVTDERLPLLGAARAAWRLAGEGYGKGEMGRGE